MIWKKEFVNRWELVKLSISINQKKLPEKIREAESPIFKARNFVSLPAKKLFKRCSAFTGSFWWCLYINKNEAVWDHEITND